MSLYFLKSVLGGGEINVSAFCAHFILYTDGVKRTGPYGATRPSSLPVRGHFLFAVTVHVTLLAVIGAR